MLMIISELPCCCWDILTSTHIGKGQTNASRKMYVAGASPGQQVRSYGRKAQGLTLAPQYLASMLDWPFKLPQLLAECAA